MAMKYRMQIKRNPINDKALYYAIPVKSGIISTRRIAEHIARQSSLTPGDVRATLIGLAEVMEFYLQQGYSVKLDDLGTFSISATSDGFEKPEECTPHRVRANKLCFIADPLLKKNLEKVRFEREK